MRARRACEGEVIVIRPHWLTLALLSCAWIEKVDPTPTGTETTVTCTGLQEEPCGKQCCAGWNGYHCNLFGKPPYCEWQGEDSVKAKQDAGDGRGDAP